MGMRVLLVQSDTETARALTRFFRERDDEIWHTDQLKEAITLLDLVDPHLLVLDLHFPGNEWLDILRQSRLNNPELKIIITNKTPDLERELMAQNHGARVFLRPPFTRKWLERALQRLDQQDEDRLQDSPAFKVTFPFIYKIFLPYLLIAILSLILVSFFINKIIQDLEADHLQSDMLMRKHTLEYVTAQKNQNFSQTVRSLTDINHLPAAIQAGDMDQLADILENLDPDGYEAVEILSAHGVPLISMHWVSSKEPGVYVVVRDESFFRDVEFVRRWILSGTSGENPVASGLVQAPWGDFLYVGRALFVENVLQGFIFAGFSLDSLSSQFGDLLGSEITIYDTAGRLIRTTLSVNEDDLTMPYSQVRQVLSGNRYENQAREMYLQDEKFLELFLPWENSSGDVIGLLGIVNPYDMQYALQRPIPTWTYGVIGVWIAVIFLIAWLLARKIKTSTQKYAQAARQIASGNLEVKLEGGRGDELDNLASHLNMMVSGMQERLLEHDLFGISNAFNPEVPLHALSIKNLHLEGQQRWVTAMRIQPQGFTQMIREHGPKPAFEALNALFQVLIEVTLQYEGMVNHFEGEALLVYFGLFPHSLSPAESALQACIASQKMRQMLRDFNHERNENGLPLIPVLITIDNGLLSAGVLHVKDRIAYGIVGEVIDSLREISRLDYEEDTDQVLVSPSIHESLAIHRSQFDFIPVELKTKDANEEMLKLFRLD